MKKILIFSAVVYFLTSCSNESNNVKENGILYYGGDIITMRGDERSYLEALLTNGKTVVFVGSHNEAKKLFASAQTKNINGKILYG